MLRVTFPHCLFIIFFCQLISKNNGCLPHVEVALEALSGKRCVVAVLLLYGNYAQVLRREINGKPLDTEGEKGYVL